MLITTSTREALWLHISQLQCYDIIKIYLSDADFTRSDYCQEWLINAYFCDFRADQIFIKASPHKFPVNVPNVF